MRIFSLKTCDTCRKAIQNLRDAGHEVQVFDIRDRPVPPEEMSRFLRTFGDELVNKRSTTWRNLSESEREEQPLALLASYPTLMKRPVIDADGQLYLGWGEKVRAALLG